MKKRIRGFTLIEILITIAVIAALSGIAVSMQRSAKQKANQVAALQKIKSLGGAFSVYVAETNGSLPFEDSTGSDDWTNAAKPENQEAWYNALPRLMQAKTVGELNSNPVEFYHESYPLYIPGAPYPGLSKRLSIPHFAVGMNSRLQRKNDEGVKIQGKYSQIYDPVKTVVLLERGLPNDKKTMPTQRGFDASPKANARAFAARHVQKGCLIFADGHAELHAASDLLTSGGGIIFPQTAIIWTLNPDMDPN